MKVIIYSQGVGHRWRHPTIKYKQLIPYNNEPVIARTVRQLVERGIKKDSIVIVGLSEVYKNFDVMVEELSEPTGSIIQGLLSTATIWGAANNSDSILLLGDVCFSDAAIDTILSSYNRGMSFFGRREANPITGKPNKEIFGLRIWGPPADFNWVRSELFKCLQTYPVKKTKLWDFYHLVAMYSTIPFVVISDFTDDIDSVSEYNYFWKKMDKSCVMEASKCYESSI